MGAIFLLTTIDRVKRFAEKKSDSNDAMLTTLIEEVSVQIKTYLDREIKIKERTQLYDVEPGQTEIQLSAYPFDLTKTFTVHNDTARDYGSLTLIDDANVVKYGKSGIVKVEGRSLACGPQAIKVVYTGGIALNTSDLITNETFVSLSKACEEQAAHIYQRRRQLGSTSHSGAGGSVSHEPGVKFLDGVVQALAPFRNMSMHDGPTDG